MTLFVPLDHAWSFRRLAPDGAPPGVWSAVDLPHSPFVADLDGRDHWFGECEYERSISRPPGAPAGRCVLAVGAAMHSAVVLVDGVEVGWHSGGYLPFEVDLTAALGDGRTHRLILRLDNRDNPEVPPGKSYDELDFCWYGGLYRSAELRCYPLLYLTDPVGAAAVASGGIFIRTLAASAASARVSVQAHLRHDGATDLAGIQLEVELLQGPVVVARAARPGLAVAAGATLAVGLELIVTQPHLWQPDAPALYHAQVAVRGPDGRIIDSRTERFGIRRIGFSRATGFTINGTRRRLRGVNRHQDYPYAGYALPRAAQYRDARRIKEAGFDYVRLSHYPQSPDFLAACDELGIVVMNCIPGWQFLGGERFRAACRQNARDLIRRDRNHPCVVLWELSLNETRMDDDLMAELHAIGHAEYPGDQMFTCGWIDRYDVFIHSRQHGEIHRWQNGDKALVVAEYGDWEFYSADDGFAQKAGTAVLLGRTHARQRRQDGERGLRQQAANHLIALNDTLGSPAVLDGLWSMFDYPRGYHPHRAACGVMDLFRLPKFSYYFYRSQRDPGEGGPGWTGGPMVFIASLWTAASNLRVPVFSNCDEIELRLDGVIIGRLKAARSPATHELPHPPFRFELPAFVPGVLTATGFLGGQPVAVHHIATPGAPVRLELELDTVGLSALAGESDLVIAHARVLDAQGTLCCDCSAAVEFALTGDAHLLGPTKATAEAGVASVVLHIPSAGTAFELTASLVTETLSLSARLGWVRETSDAASPSVPARAPATRTE